MPVKFMTLQKDIDMLELVQKFALRVCSKQWDASYSMLCSSLNLPTLAARRKQMKLSVMYKIVHGLADFPNVPINCIILDGYIPCISVMYATVYIPDM